MENVRNRINFKLISSADRAMRLNSNPRFKRFHLVNEEIEKMNSARDRMIKKRAQITDKAKQARKFGIIIGLKKGQKFGGAEFLQKKFLEKYQSEFIKPEDEN